MSLYYAILNKSTASCGRDSYRAESKPDVGKVQMVIRSAIRRWETHRHLHLACPNLGTGEEGIALWPEARESTAQQENLQWVEVPWESGTREPRSPYQPGRTSSNAIARNHR